MVKPSGIKRSSSKGIAGVVTTSAKANNQHTKTVAKRMSGVQRRQKVSRKGLPNIKGAENFKQMAGGAGMNDENKLRKIRRQNQGL